MSFILYNSYETFNHRIFYRDREDQMENHLEDYNDFGRCLHISNGIVELKIPLQFGIRIIYCALKGRENIFYEQPTDEKDLRSQNGWRIYGGHRIWAAPECDETYFPDNQPVSYSFSETGLSVVQPPDEYLHVQKSLEIHFDTEDMACVWLRHTIRNVGSSVTKLGIWTVSAMAYGSVLSIPFVGKRGGCVPQRFISLWGDTDIRDPRVLWETDRLVFRHAADDRYFKMGLWCQEGVARCAVKGQMLEKHFDTCPNLAYPDNNVNIEVFQCRHMMEFEVLGPFVELAPGEEAVHLERWRITDIPDKPSLADVDQI
jgi:hypothetical protein